VSIFRIFKDGDPRPSSLKDVAVGARKAPMSDKMRSGVTYCLLVRALYETSSGRYVSSKYSKPSNCVTVPVQHTTQATQTTSHTQSSSGNGGSKPGAFSVIIRDDGDLGNDCGYFYFTKSTGAAYYKYRSQTVSPYNHYTVCGDVHGNVSVTVTAYNNYGSRPAYGSGKVQ